MTPAYATQLEHNSPPEPNRRDRKKQRTRSQIVRAARDLFIEQGYETTTVAEIADQADVALSTLFKHFASKQDVFFADYGVVPDDFVRALQERDRTQESLIDLIIRWNRLALERKYDAGRTWDTQVVGISDTALDSRWFIKRRQLIDSDPLLYSMELQLHEPSMTAMRQAFANELGDSDDGIRPKLAAEAIHTFTRAFARWLNAHPDIDYAEAMDQMDVCLRSTISVIIELSPLNS